MEPITMATTATLAVGTILGTKAVEKTGLKIGELLWDKSAKFLESLKQVSPDTVTAIEKAPDEPLDYGQAILEVEKAATANPNVAEAMQELVAAAEANPHPKINEVLQEIEKTLNSQHPSIHNENKSKLQEKGLINQGVQSFQGNSLDFSN